MSRRSRYPRHQHPAQGPRPRTSSPDGDRIGTPHTEGPGTDSEPRQQARGEAAAPRIATAEVPSRPAPQPVVTPPAPPAPTAPAADADGGGHGQAAAHAARPTCTVAQLRRFIKSRPWVPLHELRRRFGIDGGDDDVSPIRVGDQLLFIGLPSAESGLVAELLAGGDVGYELGLDPRAPIVVGVYPMRPVPRG